MLAINALRHLKDAMAARTAQFFREKPELASLPCQSREVMDRYQQELAKIDAAIEWLQRLEG